MPARPIAKLSRADLADLNAFLVIERLRSFTKAAVELGISTSALSHAMRNLEQRLGVRLLNRTSRTVAPTDAGVSLAKRLQIGFDEIGGALNDINQHRDRPVGRLRINSLSDGARLVLNKVLPRFLDTYPDVAVEIAVDDRMIDIVDGGFDAGIRFGGTIHEDFIAIRIGTRLRWVTVASPRYLNLHGRISIPEDLKSHECIQLRTGLGTVYRWEFDKNDERLAIEAPGRLCVNETALAIDMALSGHGIAYCLQDRVASHVARGELQYVLQDWTPVEPPFTLYYPGHRQMPPGLRELIDMLREDLAPEHYQA